MSFVRSLRFQTVFILLALGFAIVGCGQRPPLETSLLPAPDESATPFVNVNVAAASTEQGTATPQGTGEATLAATTVPETPAATETAVPSLATDTPAATVAPTLTVSATLTVTTNEVVSPTNSTPAASAAQTPAADCFGSINGSVIADLNGNGQPESGEPGILGAKLFLYNSSGVVGLYTTGNGQFYFPGLVAGKYTLTAAPPNGFTAASPPSYELDVKCSATITQNILMNNGAAPSGATTRTPSSSSRSKITPVAGAQGTPRANKGDTGNSKFKAFDVSAVYDIGGCGAITAPGLYRLALSLTSQWDCIQINSDNVIFDCQGYSLNGMDGNGYGIVVHQVGNLLSQRPARNIEIRNCKSSKHKYGIFVDAADNLYIHDNVITDNFRDTDARNFGQFLGLTEGGGIRVGSTTNALIANNTSNGSAIGIDVRSGSGITVRGNTTNGNTAWGVHFYNVQFSEISSNNAADNLRYCTWGNGTVGPGCDAGGIMLQAGSSKNVVRDNVISGSNGNGIFIKAHGTPCGDGNIIQNNTISGALYNAIELSFCRDNQLMGNRISNSLDGIWLGFATNNTINAGNELRDLSNHGIISWNSSNNNVSTNTIVNSRIGLYFYSSDYDRQQFYFVQGSPADHISTGNCLCDNTLLNNASAAIYLNNSLKNQITNNRLTNNGINFMMEGNTAGNIIQDNVIQGGSLNIDAPRPRYALFSNKPAALTAYDAFGRVLARAQVLRALATDWPGDTFDLRWFKAKMRISLGLAPLAPLTNQNALVSLFGNGN